MSFMVRDVIYGVGMSFMVRDVIYDVGCHLWCGGCHLWCVMSLKVLACHL
jgi:hypothetical protein